MKTLNRRANKFLLEGRSVWAIIYYGICYLFGNHIQNYVGTLAESLANIGRLRLAMRILQKYNDKYDLQFSIAYVYSLQGDREKAIKIYEKLIEKSILLSQPINYKLIANLIEEYRATNRTQDAQRIIQTYVEGKLPPDCPAYLYYNVGCVLEQAQEHANALRYYELAREHGFDDVSRLAHNIGVAYAGLQNHTAALEQFTLALQLSPKADRSVELFAIGDTYKDIGNVGKAREYFIQSAKMGNKKAQEELASDPR